jgi:hypothetical protein
MKTEPKLSYNQLRQILSLTISNQTLKAKLEDFLLAKQFSSRKKTCYLLGSVYSMIIELLFLFYEDTGDKYEENMPVPVTTLFGSYCHLHTVFYSKSEDDPHTRTNRQLSKKG